MNYRMIGFVIGRILLVESALMALPLLTAALYREPLGPFLIPVLLLAGIGVLLGGKNPGRCPSTPGMAWRWYLWHGLPCPCSALCPL